MLIMYMSALNSLTSALQHNNSSPPILCSEPSLLRFGQRAVRKVGVTSTNPETSGQVGGGLRALSVLAAALFPLAGGELRP